jgi:hypothetical protein
MPCWHLIEGESSGDDGGVAPPSTNIYSYSATKGRSRLLPTIPFCDTRILNQQ